MISALNLDSSELRFAQIFLELLSIVSGQKHEALLYVFLLVATNKILDKPMLGSAQLLTLAIFFESVKGLIGFSSFPLLHLPFGNICHFQKEPAVWINEIIQLCWHQNNRKVRFLCLEQVRNFRVKKFIQNLWLFSSSSMSSSARANKTRYSDKYQQLRCMLASRACSSVMILVIT